MASESRVYDDEQGDPVVVLVVKGTHDVSRLVHLLDRGNVEQGGLAQKVMRQVRRHNGARAALKLLRDHGGKDFTGPDEETMRLLRKAVADPGLHTLRRDDRGSHDGLEPLYVMQARAAYRALFQPVPSGERGDHAE